MRGFFSRILGFTRDLVKDSYRIFIQLWTRLFHIDRESPSSISFSAVLDVIPQSPEHSRNRLVIKRKSLIERKSVVNTWHGDVMLEEGAFIGIGSIVIGPVTFKKNSGCSQHCFISGESHKYTNTILNFRKQGFDIKEVVIDEDAWIGSNCVILPGIHIGKHSVLGAGSVVTKDIPDYSLAVGNPARVIKQFDFVKSEWKRV